MSFVARVFLVEVGDLFGDGVFLCADARGLLEGESAGGITAPDGDAGGDGAEEALGEGEFVSALGFAEDEAQKLDAIADISKGLAMKALESDGFAEEAASVVFAAAAEFEVSKQDIATDLREDTVVLLDLGLVGDIKSFEGPETGASEIAVGEVDQREVSATCGESGKIAEFVVKAEELTCDTDGVGKVAVVAVDADQVLKGGFAQASITGIATAFDAAFEVDACIFPFFAQIGDPTEIKVSSGLGDGVVFGCVEIDLSGAKMRESMDVVLGGKDGEAAPCDDQFERLLETQGPTDLLDQGPTAECFVVTLGEDGEFAVDVLGGAAAIAVAGGGVGFVFA